MTARISIATIFLTITLSLLAGSFANTFSKDMVLYSWNTLELSLFAIFFILSRVKWYLDDIQSFKRTTIINRAIKISYFLAIFSWFFWILSAYCLDNPEGQLKYIFLFIAIFLATICLFLEISIEKEPIKEIWVFYNLLYLLLIGIDILKLLPGYIILFGLIIVCLYDIKDSRSLLALEELNNK